MEWRLLIKLLKLTAFVVITCVFLVILALHMHRAAGGKGWPDAHRK